MSYRIIADSCCDKTQYIKDMDNITFVPLTLSVGDYTIPDDNNFDQDDFIGRMKASETVAKTACPAPDVHYREKLFLKKKMRAKRKIFMFSILLQPPVLRALLQKK